MAERELSGDITKVAADAIVNAANPSLMGGGDGEPDLLASCYRSCLELASAIGCGSIAFRNSR